MQLYNINIVMCTMLENNINPRGGDSAYERGGDAHWKFWIKPPKETDLGMAQPFLDP